MELSEGLPSVALAVAGGHSLGGSEKFSLGRSSFVLCSLETLVYDRISLLSREKRKVCLFPRELPSREKSFSFLFPILSFHCEGTDRKNEG